MNTKFFYALMAGMLLGGCNLTDTTDDATDDTMPADGLEQPSGPIGDPADGLQGNGNGDAIPVGGGAAIIPDECLGAPVVGIINYPEGRCDDIELPPEFAWEPMFESGSPDVVNLQVPVPAELTRYCKFEWVGAQPMEHVGQYQPVLDRIQEYPYMDLDSVAADCMGFNEQSDLYDPAVTDALRDAFMLNVDAVDSADLGSTAGYREPVRVALLDSVSQWAIDNSQHPHNHHGIYMSSLIGTIACPDWDQPCLDQIHHLLAMPRADYQQPDWQIGMDYASKVDVAVQIYAAVQQWREAKLANPKAANRLVLNVSLGYNRLNAGVDEFTRGPQASLKAALDFASCHGALVFAASGNVRDEHCPQNDVGPLAPAAFEALRAPTESECNDMGFVPDWQQDFPVFDPNGERPLVYAIGALDARDNDAVNARGDSMPKLVALGANGIGRDSSMALTGSSVSTAVATATAALLWSYNPRLRPDEVYAAMYDSGWDLQRNADFGLNGPGEPMHRISVCAALDTVCAGGDPNTCPQLGCVAGPAAADGNLGWYAQEVDNVLSDPATAIKYYLAGSPTAPVCSPQALTELVVPQPEVPVCGHCKADIAKFGTPDDDTVTMTIDESYKGLVDKARLIFEDSLGLSHVVEFDDDVVSSLNNPTIDVVQVFFDGEDTVAATLEFDLVTGGSQANPVIIEYGI